MEKRTLYKYFGGTASLQEGLRVKEWVESSESNKEEFYRERRMYDAMLIHADSDSRLAARKLSLRKVLITISKVAAIVVMTLLLRTFFVSTPNSEEETWTTVNVPAGQRTHVELPDGSVVWLNARSELRYSSLFNSTQRKIFLKGEAFFTVAKNEQLPFVVCTELFGIEATGTRFNVDAYPGMPDFETALMEGGVNVYSLHSNDEKVRLKPGEKAYYAGGRLHVEVNDDMESYRWRDGLICFQNRTFDYVMSQFEKSFGFHITVHNRNVREYTYTGKFRQSDGVDYALRVLQRSIGFKYTKDDERETIDIY